MNLRKWLLLNDMSIKEMAYLLNIHRSYIHMWMSRKKLPGKKTLANLTQLTQGAVKTWEDLIDPRR